MQPVELAAIAKAATARQTGDRRFTGLSRGLCMQKDGALDEAGCDTVTG